MRNCYLFTALLIFQFLYNSASVQAEEQFKIAAIFPLSGKESRQGQLGRIGVEQSIAELGKEFNAEVIFEDSQSSSKEAVAAYNKVKSLDQINAVITMGSPTAMALLPMANKDKIPLLVMAVVPGFSAPNDYGFRLMGVASGFGEKILQIVSERNYKKVALLYSEDDYGSGYNKFFSKELEQLGINAGSISYIPGTTDYRPQLLKLKKAEAQVIVLGSWAQEAALILKQANELKIKPEIFACPGACDNPDLMTAGSPATDNVLVIASSAITSDKLTQSFIDKFSETPTSVVLRFYDAVRILNQAFKNCAGKEAEANVCIRDSIANTSNLPGSSYPISFDSNGDIIEQYQLKVIKDGKFVGGGS